MTVSDACFTSNLDQKNFQIPKKTQKLYELVKQRILVLDGAMGTEIQALGLKEKDFRGDRFRDHSCELKGNNDVLVLTQPELIAKIHQNYFEAGADIAETNSFAATSISQKDYLLENQAYEINFAAASIARKTADAVEAKNPNHPRFVAGILGPTNKTASISPDVNDPAYRDISFDQLRISYGEAIAGLIDGGVDILMVETIFDTLNAKAALFSVKKELTIRKLNLPVMVSGTITDRSGRTLSGQTPTAFWYSVQHTNPFSIGFNCALGAEDLRQYVEELASVANCQISAYPNAGLPNAFGEYDESPKQMAEQISEWAESGLVNIVGGCCGTTPEHIRAIAEAVFNVNPRRISKPKKQLCLSGLEPFEFAT